MEKATIDIYNVMGHRLYNYDFYIKDNIAVLNTQLSSGIYYFSVKDAKDNIYSFKKNCCNKMRIIIKSFLIILSGVAILATPDKIIFAQINLVFNPSFELIYSCPSSYNQLDTAIGWNKPIQGGGILTFFMYVAPSLLVAVSHLTIIILVINNLILAIVILVLEHWYQITQIISENTFKVN